MIVLSNTFEFRCFRTAELAGPPVVFPAPGAASAAYPDSSTALFFSRAGVHRLNLEAALPGVLPPAEMPEWLREIAADFTATSSDGKTLAIGAPREVLTVRGDQVRHYPSDDTGNPVSLSPDGRWFALGAQHNGTVRVWDLNTSASEPVHVQISPGGSVPEFSPDGALLVCCMQDANVILRTGTWEEVRRFPRAGGGPMGFPTFSADCRTAVLPADFRTLEVRDGRTWALRYRLFPPQEEQATRVVLSSDGRYVAAVGARQEVYVWDLSAVDAMLSEMGLMPESEELKH